MSTGLLAVAEMLGMIGEAAKLATADIRETVKAAETATATSSSVARAAGTGSTTPGMGSATGTGVTTNGLAAALQITRGRSL